MRRILLVLLTGFLLTPACSWDAGPLSLPEEPDPEEPPPGEEDDQDDQGGSGGGSSRLSGVTVYFV